MRTFFATQNKLMMRSSLADNYGIQLLKWDSIIRRTRDVCIRPLSVCNQSEHEVALHTDDGRKK